MEMVGMNISEYGRQVVETHFGHSSERRHSVCRSLEAPRVIMMYRSRMDDMGPGFPTRSFGLEDRSDTFVKRIPSVFRREGGSRNLPAGLLALGLDSKRDLKPPFPIADGIERAYLVGNGC